jgi:hypothetical protein
MWGGALRSFMKDAFYYRNSYSGSIACFFLGEILLLGIFLPRYTIFIEINPTALRWMAHVTSARVSNLPGPCFVCFEERAKPSQCVCKDRFIHDDCLAKVIEVSGRSTCDVCMHKYGNVAVQRSCRCKLKRLGCWVGTWSILCALFLTVATNQIVDVVSHSYTTGTALGVAMSGGFSFVLGICSCALAIHVCRRARLLNEPLFLVRPKLYVTRVVPLEVSTLRGAA